MKSVVSSEGQPSLSFVEESSVFSVWPHATYLLIYFMVAFLGIALEPSREGVGTHRQLGLPPCGFLTITGYPCPSCGLTTSVSLGMHGHWLDALRVQPFGVYLFVLMSLVAILSLVGILKKIPFSKYIQSHTGEKLQIITAFVFLISWVYKILIMN
ncbi:DUF2752 domain-containing protein [bacterium]|nr:DUF2752 domain-containing protein [bacterium]NUN45237.1 DUF2752 domain-containing protein [bacterium]